MKVAVLYERVSERAREDEQDVLIQADAVSLALSELGHAPVELFFTPELKSTMRELQRLRPSLIFNLVESINGNGRLIYIAPAILDCLGMIYTGSGSEALFITSNKPLAKKMLNVYGIHTPIWFSHQDISNYPIQNNTAYIFKSVWEHASMYLDDNQVVLIESNDQMLKKIGALESKYNSQFYAEAYIEGREFSLSLLETENGLEILPIAETCFVDYPDGKWRIVDYRAKWEKETFEYQHTLRSFEHSRIDIPIIDQMCKIARQCWYIFGLRGYARVDFRVDQYGQPWVLEINANPCIAPDSGFVAAAKQAGLNFNQLLERIISAAFHNQSINPSPYGHSCQSLAR